MAPNVFYMVLLVRNEQKPKVLLNRSTKLPWGPFVCDPGGVTGKHVEAIVFNPTNPDFTASGSNDYESPRFLGIVDDGTLLYVGEVPARSVIHMDPEDYVVVPYSTLQDPLAMGRFYLLSRHLVRRCFGSHEEWRGYRSEDEIRSYLNWDPQYAADVRKDFRAHTPRVTVTGKRRQRTSCGQWLSMIAVCVVFFAVRSMEQQNLQFW